MEKLNHTEGYLIRILDKSLDKSNRQILLEKGWKRHSVINVNKNDCKSIYDELPSIIQNLLSDKDSLVIIATYDCAVVSNCFESEPWVQLLIVTPTKYEKRYAEGRDPRILHFKILKSSVEYDYQVNAAGICQINRNQLLNFQPDNQWTIAPKHQFELKTWISERYRQETWPDAFNNATKSANKRLKNFWKRYNEYITAAYLKLDTYEEKIDSKYTIAIMIAIEDHKLRKLVKSIRTRKNHENKTIDEAKNIIIGEIKSAFGDTVIFETDPTVSLKVAIEVREESEITLDVLRNYYKYSPHSISEFDSAHPSPVDILPKSKS